MKTVYAGGEGEIVEKKSRFIATVRPVSSEEEAVAFINEMKKLNKIGNFSEKYKVNTWKTEWRKQIEQARKTTR